MMTRRRGKAVGGEEEMVTTCEDDVDVPGQACNVGRGVVRSEGGVAEALEAAARSFKRRGIWGEEEEREGRLGLDLNRIGEACTGRMVAVDFMAASTSTTWGWVWGLQGMGLGVGSGSGRGGRRGWRSDSDGIKR